MYYDKVNRPEKLKPKKSHGSLVETAGYIPLKDQVMNMMNAGQNLVDYRNSKYDFQPDEPDDPDFFDPTRSPNYDLADASRDQEQLDQNFKRANADKKAAEIQAAKDKKAAEIQAAIDKKEKLDIANKDQEEKSND